MREISVAFQTDKSASEYIALAKLVNTYDFDAISVYCDAPFHPSFGPLLLMAPHIDHARLGPAAVSPARIAPIDIAAETALLGSVAQAGTYIGLARGAWLSDHGIEESKQPIQALRETIGIIRYLLSGTSGGYQGQIFQLAPHVRAPYPLPIESIPILIGTWGRKLCMVAGELADEVKIGGSANPDVVPVIRGYIAQGEAKADRQHGTVQVVIGAVTVVDEDRDYARYLAKRAVALYLPVVAPLDPTVSFDPEFVKRLQQTVEANDLDEAARLIPDNVLDKFAFSGNAEDLIAQAEALFEAGVGRIEFGTPHGIKPGTGIRILGEVVIPALRA
ncbi:MAG: LLM class flavin-dependent oxidoreductase [Anaerolineae bacterium]|nr:LLM class flavin-dependent oxidoreductase [Anaerolineae bacterium]